MEERILRRQLAEGLNSPLTTSAGRLFDAVAAALDVCRLRTYEGQPAMELEMAADETEDGFYPAAVKEAPDALVLDTLAIFRGVVGDRLAGVPAGVIAARFHNSLVRLLACACDLIRERTGLNLVALSGGVMQNALLFTRLHRALAERGFEVLTHTLTPPNDGSISLGQVAVAAARMEERGKRRKGEKAKRNKYSLSAADFFLFPFSPFSLLPLAFKRLIFLKPAKSVKQDLLCVLPFPCVSLKSTGSPAWPKWMG